MKRMFTTGQKEIIAVKSVEIYIYIYMHIAQKAWSSTQKNLPHHDDAAACFLFTFFRCFYSLIGLVLF